MFVFLELLLLTTLSIKTQLWNQKYDPFFKMDSFFRDALLPIFFVRGSFLEALNLKSYMPCMLCSGLEERNSFQILFPVCLKVPASILVLFSFVFVFFRGVVGDASLHTGE